MNTDKIIESFEKQFVHITYPFLGGQRNLWRPLAIKETEMDRINKIEDFIRTSLESQKAELVKEIVEKFKRPSFLNCDSIKKHCDCEANEIGFHFYSKFLTDIIQSI